MAQEQKPKSGKAAPESASGNNAGRTRGRPFAPGNPGRPKGARHKATKAIEQLLEGQAEKIGQICIEKALSGDTTALRLVMERVAPVRKGRAVEINLPSIDGAADLIKSIGAILTAVGAGTLTAEEGLTIANIVETKRRAMETAELERRIEALEGRA
jgi:hypothetical protein